MKHHRLVASGGAVVVLVGLALVADGAGNRAHPRIAAVPGPVTQVVVQHRTLRVVRHRRLPARRHAHHTSRTSTGARHLVRLTPASPAHSAAGRLTPVTRIRYGARPRPARSTRPVVPVTTKPTTTTTTPAPESAVAPAPQPVATSAPQPVPAAAPARPVHHRPSRPAATPTRTTTTTTTAGDD